MDETFTAVRHLVYLSYGQGRHVQEIAFSALVAAYRLRADNVDCRIVVYTDRPPDFSGLPVAIEYVPAETMAEWGGPMQFGHRRKILAIKDALDKFGDSLIYLDADTYFTRHPARAYERIAPGRTIMHIGEYCLWDNSCSRLRRFVANHELRAISGARWSISPRTAMFNAGVVGLHASDVGLLDEVLHLTDQIYPHVPSPIIEQFAFSVCLHQRTTLLQTHDIVHHYWQPERRAEFDRKLDRVFGDRLIPSNKERLKRLLSQGPARQFVDRPFSTPVARGIVRRAYGEAWRVASRVGLAQPLRTVAGRIKSHAGSNDREISEDKAF